MSHYPNHREAEIIYAFREAQVEKLAMSGSITSAAVLELDHLGRCKIANELWGICDEQARQTLLNDPHHFVRSCAKLAV